MDADRIARARRIEQWADAQRRTRQWINFADMADWCARENGSIRPCPQLLSDAYRQLGEAIARGEFEVGDRSRVKFRHPAVRWLSMTRETFDGLPFDLGDDVKAAYLRYCWVPRALAARWFEARRISPPPWLDNTGGNAVAPPPDRPEQRSQTVMRDAAPAALRNWYIRRRDAWPTDHRPPSAEKDLADSRSAFPNNRVTRSSIRAVRSELAPATWTAHGRRKHAPK